MCCSPNNARFQVEKNSTLSAFWSVVLQDPARDEKVQILRARQLTGRGQSRTSTAATSPPNRAIKVSALSQTSPASRLAGKTSVPTSRWEISTPRSKTFRAPAATGATLKGYGLSRQKELLKAGEHAPEQHDRGVNNNKKAHDVRLASANISFAKESKSLSTSSSASLGKECANESKRARAVVTLHWLQLISDPAGNAVLGSADTLLSLLPAVSSYFGPAHGSAVTELLRFVNFPP